MTGHAGRTVVLASRNRDKVRELQDLFAGLPFVLVGADDYPGLPDVVEDGTTILGNATRKALATAAFTGEIALADDTSLQVRELNGWPDIFAARFSGPDATYRSNTRLLLDLLSDVPVESRQARFASACVWIDPRPATGSRTVLGPGEHPVAGPALCRWLLNPWAGARPYAGAKGLPAREWDYWNSLMDRRREWAGYVTLMLADPTSFGGHDLARLRAVAEELLALCPDSPLHPGHPGNRGHLGHLGNLGNQGAPARDPLGSIRLPDPRIWTARGPGARDPRPSPYFPAGLPHDAPGPAVSQDLWLEISTEGKLLGAITEQPLGLAGFGYDPVFRPQGRQHTLAELDAEAKHRISHRGLALRRLKVAVRAAYRL